MDKFDQSIKQASETNTIEPTAHFVDQTMDKVKKFPKRAKVGWGIKAWGGSVAGIVAVLAVVFIVAPLTQNSSSQLNSTNASKVKNGAISTTSPAKSTKAPEAANTPATLTGTDNASLDNDLNAVSASINQENADQSAANSGINDSAQEIAVPTN